MSKMGVHTTIGGGYGFGPFLQSIKDRGGQLKAIKAVDDFGRPLEARRLFPDIVTVGRIRALDQSFYPNSDPKEQAARWYELARPKWLLNPHIRYWEILNEISSHWSEQSELYLALMPLVERDGFHVVIYNCSTGNPPLLQDDGGAAFAAIARACRRAAQGGHLYGQHEYGMPPTNRMSQSSPWHTLRYRFLLDYLRQNDSACGILIGECAPAAGYNFTEAQSYYLDDLAWYDEQLMQDDEVTAYTVFTLGAGEWTASDYSPLLPALADYIVAHPDEPPPPPPPPTKRLGDARVAYRRKYWRVNSTATLAQFLESAKLAYPELGTVGFSPDDAGIGVGLAEKKVVEIGGEFLPSVIEPWYQTEYGVPPENVDHIPYPGSTPQTFKLLSPVEGIPLFITSPFNAPRDYDGDGIADDRHEGVDLRSVDANGNPVYTLAAADGVVEHVFNNGRFGGWGRYVIVRHDRPDGSVFKSAHAHLERIDVAEGQVVRAGQRLGLTGNTGNTGDPPAIHLHYTLYWIGHPDPGWEHNGVVDPTRYLPPQGTIQPPPTQTAAFGLHLRAGGLDHNHPSFAAELDILRTARMNVVKFTNNSTFESLDGLIAAGCNPAQMVMRLHMAGSDPNLTNAAPFFQLHSAWIERYIARGGVAIEVHNEPNRSEEWPLNASAFALWFDSVRSLIKAAFPTARVGFPGLSPNPNVPAWVSACATAISRADWMGAHCYWVSPDQLTHPEHGGYWQRYVSLGKLIVITEFSNPSPTVAKADKARQYLGYIRTLPFPPVAAAYCFVSSATGGFVYETWAGSDIPRIVGAR